MTDNEIIKALGKEIHLIEYFDGFSADNVDLELLKNTLDLIKRQQAEIEGQKKELRACIKEVSRNREIVRNQAITEFAERLIQETRTFSKYEGGWECDVFAISAEDIDRIAKEMTEGLNR